MKGYFKVKELNNNGLFVSDMDWDNSFKDKSNPKGNFVMIIEPFVGDNKEFVYYQKVEDGFIVKGEAYILTGRKDILKKEVSDWIANYQPKDFEFIEKEITCW